MGHLEPIAIENLMALLAFDLNDIFNERSNVTFVLTLTIIVLLLGSAFKKRSTHKLSSMATIPWIKPSLPLIGPIHFIQYRHDLAKLQEYWASKYPRLAQAQILGRKYVILNSPDMMQKLLISTDFGHLEKPEEVYSKLFMDVVGKGLLIAKPKIWQLHRKKLNKCFNYESLKNYVRVFKDHGNKLVHELDSYKGSNGASVGDLIHDVCLEIITEIVMGDCLNDTALRSEFLQDLHQRMTRFSAIIVKLQREPWLLLDFVWNLHPCKKDLENTVQGVIESCNKVLQQRMDHTFNESKCVMDTMIKENWTNVDILSESINLIVGGHETISCTLNLLLFLLANDKEHQIKCQEEVDNLFDKLESTSGEELSMQSVTELKYLERCIKETLRMYPPSSMNWRELRTPLKLDDEVTLDSGTTVAIFVWGMHRNPTYFPNPNKFDPDRFLVENSINRVANSYIPFSLGSRNCIGWKMAMLEMPIIASVILRHFDISTTDKIDDIKVNFGFVLTPQKKPNIILTRRRSVAA